MWFLALLMAVIIRSMQQAAITSGGPTQTFNPGSGVYTTQEPLKAGLVFLAPSTSNGSALDHARFSLGFTDGTNVRSANIRSRDAQVSPSCVRNAFNNQLLSIYAANATSAAGQMALSSMSNTELIGTWGTLPPAAWLVNTLFFGGSSVKAYVGEVQGSATQDATTVVDTTSDPNFNFPYDLLITVGRGVSAFDGTSANNAIYCIGLSIWDGSAIVQYNLSFSDENGTSRTGCNIATDRIYHIHAMGTPTLGDSLEITTRSSTAGFTITKRGAGGNQPRMSFLALNFGGAIKGLKLFTRDSRTTTGNDAFTDPGFIPQALIGLFTQITATGTIDTGADSGCFGFGCATGTSEEFSSEYMSEDNVATTNTKACTSAVFLDMKQPSGTAGNTADLSSFDASGATLNYTAVLGSARKQVYLAIGKNWPLLEGPNSVGEGLCSAVLTPTKWVEPRSVGEGLLTTALSVDRGLLAASLGEALTLAEISFDPVVVKFLTCTSIGEALLLQALGIVKGVTAGSTGEGLTAAALGVVKGVTGSHAGEALSQAALGVVRNLGANSLGEANGSLPLERERYVAAAALGEGLAKADLTRVRYSDARAVGEAVGSAGLTRARFVDARSLGESLSQLALGRARFAEARSIGEGLSLLAITFDLGIVHFLNCTSVGEALLSCALAPLRYLTLQSVGESLPVAQVGRVRPIDGRSLGESLPSLNLTRGKHLDARTQGESLTLAQLLRVRHAEYRSVGESDVQARLGVIKGITGICQGEGETKLAVAVTRWLAARTHGEALSRAQVIFAILNRYSISIDVVRAMTGITVTRKTDTVEVKRSTTTIETPYKS